MSIRLPLRPRLLFTLLPILVLAGSCLARQVNPGPRRIVLFIGDGVGVGYWTAALLQADSLAIRNFPVVGLVDTRADPEIVTDSAASASAFATGVSTCNGTISTDAGGRELRTVLELAEERGLATGLVVTCALTHATPAAFAAHVPRRSMQNEIAEQMAAQDIEVLLGGGRRYFERAPGGGPTLLEQMRERYTWAGTAAEFHALDLERVDRLLGLFAAEHPPAAAEREPELGELTAAALSVLDHDPDGFFLMVEGSQPDWLGHDNAGLDDVVAEMLDFDRAIAVGLAYARTHPETLILVTADHETGGLAVEGADGPGIRLDYTTGGHTAELVPLFAIGPEAGRFGGIRTNAEVGALLQEIIGG